MWTMMNTLLTNLYNDVLLIVIIVAMIVILAAVIITLKALKAMIRVTMPEILNQEVEDKAKKKELKKTTQTSWSQRFLGLRPLSEEKDIMIDHDFDGIKELDNPIPMWFNGMFYASIVFAVIYLLVYHVFGWGLNQDQEYEREMARAEAARQEYLAQSANNVDENTVQVDASANVIQAGSAIFSLNCAVCHGANGEGGIGPNLVDEFWIHGGEIEDVFKVVKYGVLDKGMVPWEQSLTPMQIAEVSNYILTLRGTNPSNQKEPQGVKVEYRTETTEGNEEGGTTEEGGSTEEDGTTEEGGSK
jgi:cytochrome c oxidase cbb3-type subunit 3